MAYVKVLLPVEREPGKRGRGRPPEDNRNIINGILWRLRTAQLFVKQVMLEDKRYIVYRNEAEAENDRKDRERIVAALDTQLKKGDKALIGNSAYRFESGHKWETVSGPFGGYLTISMTG